MKHSLLYRSIASVLILSLLLSVFIFPVLATSVSNVNDLNRNSEINEEIIKNDNLTVFDETILRANDPKIAQESMILKYVDSAQFNSARHIQRLSDLEDLNTYVFANVDGTRSVYMMHENVKYVDDNGIVKEKDISLTRRTDGYGVVRNDVELLIPHNPVNGIDLDHSGFAIKLIPQGLTKETIATQTNNSIVYDKAYGENTKLVYILMFEDDYPDYPDVGYDGIPLDNDSLLAALGDILLNPGT